MLQKLILWDDWVIMMYMGDKCSIILVYMKYVLLIFMEYVHISESLSVSTFKHA